MPSFIDEFAECRAPACATERSGTVPEVGGVVVGAGQPVLAGAWLGACGLWGAAGRWCRLSDRPRA